jgi:hypothetical protein
MRRTRCAGWSGRRLALGVLLAALVSGCGFIAGAAVGGAGVAYAKGEARKPYPRTVAEVYAAAVDVLADMEVVITEKLLGDERASIKGRTAGGQDLSMSIKRQARGVSLVGVRVGLLGDKEYSSLIFIRLDKKLGV